MNEITPRQALEAQMARRAPATQATHVEQSRAVAQVQGALLVAMNNPRDTFAAVDRMREACRMMRLADRAFFRYSRGGSQITGPSIHLATELARCWGNVDYGVVELDRDDARGQSEMMAYAWDLETNNRVTTSFIVPHKRDKKGGPQALVDLRDIYENNANNAARRLRECIFRVLPTAFVEEAKEVCEATMRDGGGVPLTERRAKLLEAFAALDVSRDQIERKMGRKADTLTELDLSTLRVVYTSIKRGEATKAEEFPSTDAADVTAELSGQHIAAPTPATTEPEPTTVEDDTRLPLEDIPLTPDGFPADEQAT